MKDTIKKFLSNLEGYHQRLKELHWSTTCKAEHLLTDDIDSAVLEYEDRLAEVSMGCSNIRFGINDLKTMIPDSKNLKNVLDELKSDIISLKNEIGENKKYNGIHNVLDDFIEDVDKWQYLETFK